MTQPVWSTLNGALSYYVQVLGDSVGKQRIKTIVITKAGHPVLILPLLETW